jgi:uncharacterized RDD family membrane protein YckC
MFKFLKTQKQQEFANPSKRFLAYSIDVFIVTILRYLTLLLISFLWFSNNINQFLIDYKNFLDENNYTILSNKYLLSYLINHPILYQIIFIIIILFLIGSLYWIILPMSKLKATLGKYWLNISIINKNKQPLNLYQSIIRYLVALIPWFFHIVIFTSLANQNFMVLVISIIFVTFWYETNILKISHKAMHDYICKTKVIRNS